MIENEADQVEESSGPTPKLASDDNTAIEDSLNQIREALIIQSEATEHLAGTITSLTRWMGVLESKVIDLHKPKVTISKVQKTQQDQESAGSHACRRDKGDAN